jgi:hypothetical protein
VQHLIESIKDATKTEAYTGTKVQAADASASSTYVMKRAFDACDAALLAGSGQITKELRVALQGARIDLDPSYGRETGASADAKGLAKFETQVSMRWGQGGTDPRVQVLVEVKGPFKTGDFNKIHPKFLEACGKPFGYSANEMESHMTFRGDGWWTFGFEYQWGSGAVD